MFYDIIKCCLQESQPNGQQEIISRFILAVYLPTVTKYAIKSDPGRRCLQNVSLLVQTFKHINLRKAGRCTYFAFKPRSLERFQSVGLGRERSNAGSSLELSERHLMAFKMQVMECQLTAILLPLQTCLTFQISSMRKSHFFILRQQHSVSQRPSRIAYMQLGISLIFYKGLHYF